jgi:hypothetical protein
MAPFFLVFFSLRKLAYLPIAAVSTVALGAAWGSFDLSRRTVAMLLPPAGSPRPGSSFVAGGASCTVGALIVALREVLFSPAPVAAPALPPAGAPLAQRLQGAALLARHGLLHYPYKFRFLSALVAGAGSGATWAVVDGAYRVKASAASGGGGAAATAAVE